MALKLRPTGLGYGIDKDSIDYSVFAVSGRSAASTKFGGPRASAVVLGAALPQQAGEPAHRQSRCDFGGSQGAVSEVLGCLEGLGEDEEVS